MNEPLTPTRGARLNVGCGRSPLPGWINLDLQILAGVDVAADVSSGLPFRSVSAVYAEHFLEHLGLDEAITFLADVHRVLEPDGWLRLSTPNLEWVLTNLYDHGAPAERDRGALDLNRAFYGWEHQFLWDWSFLERVLLACGFTDLRSPGYGVSSLEFFRGLERHERNVDRPGLPHVLVVEARKGPARPEILEDLRRLVAERFLPQMEEARLRRARLEIERLDRELKRKASMYQEARWTIERMEASRFWKARNLWFRLKEALGLVPRES